MDTLKRHQRYSIRYHCGWPSLGIWGSATHYGLTALPEPFLRACGLHRVCTRLKKIKTAEPFYDVQSDSMYESTWKSTIRHFLPPLEVPVLHIFFKKKTFSSGFMYSILSIEATYYFHVPKGQLWSCFDLFVWRLFHPRRTFQTNQNSFFILYIKFDNFAVWNYLTSS